MSITVTKHLDTISPIGNEMLLELRTNNHFSTAGSNATLVLTFSGIDTTVGHTFKISWNNIEITFSLAIAPDDSGNQLFVAVGGQTIDGWIAQILQSLQGNYYLVHDFEMESDTVADTITLTAKEKGAAYSITVDENNLSNVVMTPTAGTDPVERSGYELLCRTNLFDGSDLTFISEDRVAPTEGGLALFDLHDLFSSELVAEHTWPEVSETFHALRSNHIKRFRPDYAEVYENTVRKLNPYFQAVYAILGAFDYKMAAGLNEQEYNFLDFITTYKSFLTWQPTVKVINQTQPEKLFFLVFNDISSIEVHIKVYWTDGTDSGDQELVTIADVSQYQVYELMIGYSQIDFSKFSSKTVEKYEIWLEDDAGNVQSQTRTFILETKSFRHERIYIFRNSFGGFDTLRATGRKTQSNEYERLILDRNQDGFTIQEQYLVLERSLFTINTGWLSFAQRNWLRELLLSKEVYEIIGAYRFPVILTDEKKELTDDENYLYSLELNYRYALKDPSFTGDYTQLPLLAENLEILLNEDGEPLYA